MESLVSIIIPVYNRAHLIEETIQSILSQSYKNWECIVIDDFSTDSISKILQSFDYEKRIKFFQRPMGSKKGANVCRNYGFSLSKGKYVIWFDSDDLMSKDHIEIKIEAIRMEKFDFVVARTVNFKNDILLEPYKYEKKSYGIKAEDYILSKIHWYTYDVMLKRSIAKKITWNEAMTSWQDHNYFCKMLLITENGEYIDKILTYRRIHSDSIQSHLTKSAASFSNGMLKNRVLNYEDLEGEISNKIRKELIYDMMNHSFKLATMRYCHHYNFWVYKIILLHLKEKGLLYFFLSLISAYIFKRGHFILEKAKRRNLKLLKVLDQ